MHTAFETRKSRPAPRLFVRLSICTLILLAGVGGFVALAGLKKPPTEAQNGERPLRVRAWQTHATAVPISITGYGQTEPLNSVKISAEVTGRVQAVHPRLEVGEVIPEGELLLQIDVRDYAAAVAQNRAEVARLTEGVRRLEKQSDLDAQRLKTLQRNRDLAEAEYQRVRSLFQQHGVGTRSGVERAEQAFNAAADQADQMAQAVALYPIRIRETQSSLAAAEARLKIAQTNLQRCRIRAPFTGRVTSTAVERGQYVGPGQILLTLADDTLLEIQVPLASRDVRKWIRFADEDDTSGGAWFKKPEPVDCTLRWTEDKNGHAWTGRLHRVVGFDSKTRTVTLAVRVDAVEARENPDGLPLVAGMFCEVEIPGIALERAHRLPRAAVSFKNTVYLAVNDRLKTVPVTVARMDNDMAYITGGLSNGDIVIVTRLVDPLENALLDVVLEAQPGRSP